MPREIDQRDCEWGLADTEDAYKVSPASVCAEPKVEDLAMLIKQLAHHLKKANASDELPGKAMDYLRRHKLGQLPHPSLTAMDEACGKP